MYMYNVCVCACVCACISVLVCEYIIYMYVHANTCLSHSCVRFRLGRGSVPAQEVSQYEAGSHAVPANELCPRRRHPGTQASNTAEQDGTLGSYMYTCTCTLYICTCTCTWSGLKYIVCVGGDSLQTMVQNSQFVPPPPPRKGKGLFSFCRATCKLSKCPICTPAP